jgi:hypothetical protein
MDVLFVGAAHDSDDTALTYHWTFRNSAVGNVRALAYSFPHARTITISVTVTDPTETRHESSGRSLFLTTIARLRTKGDMRVDLDSECASRSLNQPDPDNKDERDAAGECLPSRRQ